VSYCWFGLTQARHRICHEFARLSNIIYRIGRDGKAIELRRR